MMNESPVAFHDIIFGDSSSRMEYSFSKKLEIACFGISSSDIRENKTTQYSRGNNGFKPKGSFI